MKRHLVWLAIRPGGWFRKPQMLGIFGDPHEAMNIIDQEYQLPNRWLYYGQETDLGQVFESRGKFFTAVLIPVELDKAWPTVID